MSKLRTIILLSFALILFSGCVDGGQQGQGYEVDNGIQEKVVQVVDLSEEDQVFSIEDSLVETTVVIEQGEEMALEFAAPVADEQKEEVVATEVVNKEVEESVDTDVDNVLESEIASTNQKVEVKKSKRKSAEQVVQQIDVQLKVYTPDGFIEYSVQVAEGDSAEQAMQQAKLDGLSYKTKPFSGLGAYITDINSLEEDTRAGFYWIYYINGQKAATGVSSIELKQDDLIEWRYEKAI